MVIKFIIITSCIYYGKSMKKSLEVQFCSDILTNMGNPERMKLLKKSCLNLRERRVMSDRFVSGLTVQETADDMLMDTDAFIKYQRKIFNKLYIWLKSQKVS